MGIRFRCDRWAWRARRCPVDTFWEIRHDLRSGWTAPFRWWFSARLFCWKTHDPWWFLSSKNASSSSSSSSSSGWWYTYPSEKYEFVSWDDYFQYMESQKIHVPHHQPAVKKPINEQLMRCCDLLENTWWMDNEWIDFEIPPVIKRGWEFSFNWRFN